MLWSYGAGETASKEQGLEEGHLAMRNRCFWLLSPEIWAHLLLSTMAAKAHSYVALLQKGACNLVVKKQTFMCQLHGPKGCLESQ